MTPAEEFRFALNTYLDARARYQKARDEFGDRYDWDYFGAHDIAAFLKAETQLDEAFTDAVREIARELTTTEGVFDGSEG